MLGGLALEPRQQANPLEPRQGRRVVRVLHGVEQVRLDLIETQVVEVLQKREVA